jgi:hypothetical protein
MLGTGFPMESFRPAARARSESAANVSRYEYGDTAWLMTEVQQIAPQPTANGKASWLVTIKATASKFAAMLF